MGVPDLRSLAAGRYLSLTTFRRDGRAVATPVWVVRHGDTLRVITSSDSGKAKRIRNVPRVLVATCDARGNLRTAQVDATARLLDEGGTAQALRAIRARYGLLGRLLTWRTARSARRTGVDRTIGIEIVLS